MGDKSLSSRPIAVCIIRQAGDLPQQQGKISLQIPHAGNFFSKSKAVLCGNHFRTVYGIVDENRFRRARLTEARVHPALHGRILGKKDAGRTDALLFQQAQAIRHVVAAVGGLGFQSIGAQSPFLPQIRGKAFRFRTPGGFYVGKLRVYLLAEGFRRVAFSPDNQKPLCSFFLHGTGQHLRSAENAPAKQNHHVRLFPAVPLFQLFSCQGRDVPHSAEIPEYIDPIRCLPYIHVRHSLLCLSKNRFPFPVPPAAVSGEKGSPKRRCVWSFLFLISFLSAALPQSSADAAG